MRTVCCCMYLLPVCGFCFTGLSKACVSVCAAACPLSVRHLSHAVISPSSGSAYLTVIPSIIMFIFLWLVVLSPYHCPCHCPLCGFVPAATACWGQLGVSSCLLLLSLDVFPFPPHCTKWSLNVVSERVDRVVDQNQWLKGDLIRSRSSSSFTF